jgi:sugar/nucleoside kinase (ribokinase family)
MEQPKPHYDVIIPGDYFCDIIFTGLPGFPALGQEIYSRDVAIVPGGILNSVIALRRLGVNVGWIGTVGDDFFSRFALDQAQAEGVDVSLLLRRDTRQRRVTVSLSYPDDRAFVSYVDESPDDTDLVLDALERVTCQHLHFGGLTVDERMPGLIRTCHAQGITVSMDCQCQKNTLDSPLVREVLSQLDLFMPNAVETRLLTKTDTLEQALDVLTGVARYVVVKNGAQGAVARRDGVVYHVPALPLPAIVDTTGAGDVFNAGFLAAYLRGLGVEECLRWGNYCGGMSTQGWGGIQTAPTLAQLQDWLAARSRG